MVLKREGPANNILFRRAAGDSVTYLQMIDKGSVTQTIASGGAFIIQNPSGSSLAVFDSNGNVNILGSLSQNSELYAGPKDFAIKYVNKRPIKPEPAIPFNPNHYFLTQTLFLPHRISALIIKIEYL